MVLDSFKKSKVLNCTFKCFGLRNKMADFDAIYEEEEENDEPMDDPYVKMVPDPVVVRGAGNMTV